MSTFKIPSLYVVDLLFCMLNHCYFAFKTAQDTLEEGLKKKSIYCAECYQRVKRRPILSTTVRGYSCDWPLHRRAAHIADSAADICCCDTPAGNQCNWMSCPDCFTCSTYGLKAMHQQHLVQQGFSALIAAAGQGHIVVINFLLDHGADLQLADPVSIIIIIFFSSISSLHPLT